MKRKYLAIIPARGGSKGIKKKNICLINNIPLLAHTIIHARKSKKINRIIVTTDSDEIARKAVKYGVEVIKRPKRISGDKTPMIAVIKHVLNYLKQKERYVPDLEILLQPTNPFRRDNLIDDAVSMMERNKKADSLVGVAPITPKFGYLENGYYKPVYKEGLRRQDMKCVYRENGTIFIARCDTVLKKNSLWGKHIIGFPTDELSGLDIDTPFDLRLARVIGKAL